MTLFCHICRTHLISQNKNWNNIYKQLKVLTNIIYVSICIYIQFILRENKQKILKLELVEVHLFLKISYREKKQVQTFFSFYNLYSPGLFFF